MINPAEADRVKHRHRIVAAIGNGLRVFTERDIIIQKFKMDGFVGCRRPCEEQLRDARIGFNIVIEQIIDRLVALGGEPRSRRAPPFHAAA